MADDTTGTDKTGNQGEPGAGTTGAENDTWTPPTREEWEATQKTQKDQADALKRANAESADRRKKLVELEKSHEDADTKKQREAIEAATAAMKPVAVRAEAKAAFMAAGADAAKVGKLVRLLDLSKVDIDGDDVTGLDDQVAEIKKDFPELFGEKDAGSTKTRVPRLDTTGRKPAATETKTPGQIMAEQYRAAHK